MRCDSEIERGHGDPPNSAPDPPLVRRRPRRAALLAPGRHAQALAADLETAFARVEFDHNGESHGVSLRFGWTEISEEGSLANCLKQAEVPYQVAKGQGGGVVLRWTATIARDDDTAAS
jgi:hypothetical protein